MQEMQERHVLLLGQEYAPRIGNGNLLQYSCLENSMDREAYSPWSRKESDMTEHTHKVLHDHNKKSHKLK